MPAPTPIRNKPDTPKAGPSKSEEPQTSTEPNPDVAPLKPAWFKPIETAPLTPTHSRIPLRTNGTPRLSALNGTPRLNFLKNHHPETILTPQSQSPMISVRKDLIVPNADSTDGARAPEVPQNIAINVVINNTAGQESRPLNATTHAPPPQMASIVQEPVIVADPQSPMRSNSTASQLPRTTSTVPEHSNGSMVVNVSDNRPTMSPRTRQSTRLDDLREPLPRKDNTFDVVRQSIQNGRLSLRKPSNNNSNMEQPMKTAITSFRSNTSRPRKIYEELNPGDTFNMSPLPIGVESGISALSAMSSVAGVPANNTYGIKANTVDGKERRDTYVVKAASHLGEPNLMTDDDDSSDGSSGRRQLTNDNDVESVASLDIEAIDAIKEPLELPSARERSVHEPNQATSKFLPFICH